MNTGHEGSLTTIHANTPRGAQLRLEVLVRMATELPVDAIHRQISSGVDIIIQLKKLRNGRRRVTHITEVVGIDDQRHELRLKNLFELEGDQEDGRLAPTGCLPTFMEQLIDHGYLQLESFYRSTVESGEGSLGGSSAV
jgi:pilus assembly protein CpaF